MVIFEYFSNLITKFGFSSDNIKIADLQRENEAIRAKLDAFEAEKNLKDYFVPSDAFLHENLAVTDANHCNIMRRAVGFTAIMRDYQLRVFPAPVFLITVVDQPGSDMVSTAVKTIQPVSLSTVQATAVSDDATMEEKQTGAFNAEFLPQMQVDEDVNRTFYILDDTVQQYSCSYMNDALNSLIKNLQIHVTYEPICLQGFAALLAHPSGRSDLKEALQQGINHHSANQTELPVAFRIVWFIAEFIAGKELVDVPHDIHLGPTHDVLDTTSYIGVPHKRINHRFMLYDNMTGTCGCAQTVRRTERLQSLITRLNEAIATQFESHSLKEYNDACVRWSDRDTEGNFAVEGEDKITSEQEARIREQVVGLTNAVGAQNLNLHHFDVIQRVLEPGTRPDFAGLRPEGLEVVVKNKDRWGQARVVHYGCDSADVHNLLRAQVNTINHSATVIFTPDVPSSPGLGDRVALLGVTGFQFAHIHPFNDGNGRTARYLFQATMAACGVPAAIAHAPYSMIIHRSKRLREMFYSSQDRISSQLISTISADPPLMGLRSNDKMAASPDYTSFFGFVAPSSIYFAYYDATSFAEASLEAVLVGICFLSTSLQLEKMLAWLKEQPRYHHLCERFEDLGNELLKGPMDSDTSAIDTENMARYPRCYTRPVVPWEEGRVDVMGWLAEQKDCDDIVAALCEFNDASR